MSGVRASETLDRILTVAAFDQWITVIFIDDGVLQLLAPRSMPSQQTPAWFSTLRTLELYDIHELLVDEESLHARGLHATDLGIAVEVAGRDRIGNLLTTHDRLFVC